MRYLALGLVFLCLSMLANTACGAAYRGSSKLAAASAPVGAGGAGSGAPVATELDEQLVVEGSLRLEVEKVDGLIAGLRAQLDSLGGRIVQEETGGQGESWHSQLTLRLPPQHVEAVVAYLAGHGDIVDKQLSSTDVSKTLFDQELALRTAQVTLDRLEALLRQGGLAMADVLAVEREMTRLRGEIERIKGEAQFLKDKVALATLAVGITRKPGTERVRVASAKVYPGARAAALILLSPDGRPRTRVGAGFVLHSLFRAMTLEVELYQRERGPSPDSELSTAVLATYGGAFYSDFLGRGERRYLNPYLGFRLGYAYLDSSRFALQAEAGVELFKSKYITLDANVRGTGLIGARADAAAVLGASAVIAF